MKYPGAVVSINLSRAEPVFKNILATNVGLTTQVIVTPLLIKLTQIEVDDFLPALPDHRSVDVTMTMEVLDRDAPAQSAFLTFKTQRPTSRTWSEMTVEEQAALIEDVFVELARHEIREHIRSARTKALVNDPHQ